MKETRSSHLREGMGRGSLPKSVHLVKNEGKENLCNRYKYVQNMLQIPGISAKLTNWERAQLPLQGNRPLIRDIGVPGPDG